MGMAGRKLAEERFNWKRVAAEVFQQYTPEAARPDITEMIE
jgi:hypothetical protein